jgi:uncharacterized membrane protein
MQSGHEASHRIRRGARIYADLADLAARKRGKMSEAVFQRVRVMGKKFEGSSLFSTTRGLRTVRSRIVKCSTAVVPPKPVPAGSKTCGGASRAPVETEARLAGLPSGIDFFASLLYSFLRTSSAFLNCNDAGNPTGPNLSNRERHEKR